MSYGLLEKRVDFSFENGNACVYDEGMKGHIFEFRWRAVGSSFAPYFRVADAAGQLQEIPLEIGGPIGIRIEQDNRCAGAEIDDSWRACPHGQPAGTRRCDACKQDIGFIPAQHCDGFNTGSFNAEELESLNVPHYVYLALLARGLIKVGVSAESRGFLRQIEQGSQACLVVSRGMWGVPARQLETLIKRNGLADKVFGAQKRGRFFPDITPEEAEAALQETAQTAVAPAAATREAFQKSLVSPPEFYDFSAEYHLEAGKALALPLVESQLEVGEELGGTLVSAKGGMLLISTGEERVLLDAKLLCGRGGVVAADAAQVPVGLRKQGSVQGGLF